MGYLLRFMNFTGFQNEDTVINWTKKTWMKMSGRCIVDAHFS